MIRRATWLAIGAILGILGYRRAGKLARSILPPRLAVPGRRQSGADRRPLPGGHPRQLPGGLAYRRHARRTSGRELGSAADGFLRDVREGMAEYMARHPGRSGNTLVGQQALPGLRTIPGSDNPKDGR